LLFLLGSCDTTKLLERPQGDSPLQITPKHCEGPTATPRHEFVFGPSRPIPSRAALPQTLTTPPVMVL